MTKSAAGRRRRRVAGLAVPLSILLGSTLVWQSSQAAYSLTAPSASNSWSSGSAVTLTNTMTGGVEFSASNIRPDSSRTTIAYPFAPDSSSTGMTKCIKVAYTGSPAKIRMYSTPTGDTGLQQNLIIRVDHWTGTSDVNCTGYSATPTSVYNSGGGVGAGPTYAGSLYALPADWSSASATEWTVTGNDDTWYRISWLLPSTAAAATSGKVATAVLTWEAQVS